MKLLLLTAFTAFVTLALAGATGFIHVEREHEKREVLKKERFEISKQIRREKRIASITATPTPDFRVRKIHTPTPTRTPEAMRTVTFEIRGRD